MANPVNDPKTFALCAVPHRDKAAGEAAANAFLEELRELRKKHRIKNLYTVIEVDALVDGEAVPFTLSQFCGDSTAALPMVARAYGMERERHETLIAKLIQHGRESAR